MAGIYLHIPFCRQACHYCDFHFSTNTSIKQEMVRAMADEILLRQEYLKNKQVDTIYFGGGTPSLLDHRELALLVDVINKIHRVSGDAEITLEANPDDLTPERLSVLKSLGINRLSVGIQSFDDALLHYLNRFHNAETAIQSVDAARRAGFQNISIDLIYAIPGLSHDAWKKNIAQAIALSPEHISAYTLTIEEKTVFGKWLAKGKFNAVSDSLAAEQLEILTAGLKTGGYHQYEISNFSRPGFESRHNSSYWKGAEYLGIGPSAHSYNTKTRQHNVSNNHEYVRAIRQNQIPAQVEVLTREDHINEYLLTTLRTSWGCDLGKLKHDFHYDLMEHHGDYIQTLQLNHLAIIENTTLILTEPGRLLADRISSDLFLVP
jgi:oxygen-independent coproporphyrinogen-3 oxidase